MTDYKTTIGLEIHAELKTRTKMFCSCLNDSNETDSASSLQARPNVNVCPVCLGHPGVMPTINRKAIEEVIKLGLALGGEILNHSRFDRKSYFYPDLPKGYQISQYELPLVKGGELSGVQIRRIHLEEDTARLLHGGDESLVDFNRAGVPLIELVTEPVIDSALRALEFGKEVQLILRYLDISDADMEKGQMRVEANVSVAPQGHEELGAKVELKNINSFRNLRDAIDYEVDRQIGEINKGKNITQETRGYSSILGITGLQRTKEEAHDYRYLPEPDLPPMELTSLENINLEELRLSLPELPEATRGRFKREFELPGDQVEALISERRLADFFEHAVSELYEILIDEEHKKGTKILSSYITTDVLGISRMRKKAISDSLLSSKNFAELGALITQNKISSRTAKDILPQMFDIGTDPHQIIKEKGLTQISNETEINKIIKKVIAENQEAVESYKKGKLNSLQFLAGQVMAKAKGRANPQVLQELLKKELR